MTIDEAIAFERQQAKDRRNEHYTFGIQKSKEAAEEHEQLAEWLEELKAIKDGGIPIIHGKAELELHDKVIRNESIDDMVGNLIANSRTEIIDGEPTLIVTEGRIKIIANEMKRMESDCIDKLDTHENNEDIIYEMNCPKCHYDMFEIYDRVCNGGKSKYCKITNIYSSNCGVFYGTDWDVECICPKCKTKFTFSDRDYLMTIKV